MGRGYLSSSGEACWIRILGLAGRLRGRDWEQLRPSSTHGGHTEKHMHHGSPALSQGLYQVHGSIISLSLSLRLFPQKCTDHFRLLPQKRTLPLRHLIKQLCTNSHSSRLYKENGLLQILHYFALALYQSFYTNLKSVLKTTSTTPSSTNSHSHTHTQVVDCLRLDAGSVQVSGLVPLGIW